MNVPRQDFLARTTLARDEHRRIVARHASGKFEQLAIDVTVDLDRQ